MIVFRKLLRLAEAGNKYNEARSYGGIGTVVCSLGNYEKSEENLKKSIEIFHAIGRNRKTRGIFLRVLSIITEDFWRNLLNARRKHLGFTDRMEISEMCKVLSPI